MRHRRRASLDPHAEAGLKGEPGIVCTQIGAREHFALPAAVENLGRLRRLYTDFWARPYLRHLGQCPGPVGAIASRWRGGIPSHKIVSFPGLVVTDWYGRLARRRDPKQRFEAYLFVGAAFGRQVVAHLAASGRVPEIVIGYNTGALEPMRWIKERGGRAIVCQIDAAKVHEEVIAGEAEKWPEWAGGIAPAPSPYWDRMLEEWNAADIVIVNSEWSRRALERQGVPPWKLVVVPLAFEALGAGAGVDRTRRKGRVVVLFLGRVVVEKGLPYLLDAARQLASEKELEFVIAGPGSVPESVVARAPGNVRFLGRVGRRDTAATYDRADIFVLPTLSDGFAITQLEAMARGLPVIATPNCGDVVRDGSEGILVPAGDAAALADAVRRLAGDPDLRAEMGQRAALRVGDFSLDRLAARLDVVFGQLTSSVGCAV